MATVAIALDTSAALPWSGTEITLSAAGRGEFGGVRIVLMEINTYDIAVADVKKLKEDAE